MLNDEKDIESFIIMRRLTALLVKAVLQPHHLTLFPFFQKYVLRANKNDQKSHETLFTKVANMDKDEINAETLWDSLDLHNSRLDRLILHMVSRRRVDGFEPDPNFSESTDEDRDDTLIAYPN